MWQRKTKMQPKNHHIPKSNNKAIWTKKNTRRRPFNEGNLKTFINALLTKKFFLINNAHPLWWKNEMIRGYNNLRPQLYEW
jgi:hypothetical protein